MSDVSDGDANLVILFDGVCNLCDGLVQFVVRNDRRGRFKFAALQSEAAARLAPEDAVKDGDEPKSVILVEHGKVYRESSAALRITRKLDGLWPVFYVFILIPPPIRNVVYRWIAENRYRWFGKKETCLFPTGDLIKRFL